MTDDHQGFFDRLDWFDEQDCARLDEELTWARGACPVAHTGFGEGMYVVTRYEDLVTVAAHPEIFSSTMPGLLSVPVALPPIDVDPPLHHDFRAFLDPAFSKSALQRYAPVLRQLADELVDGFAERGEVEFVGEFAIPFTAGALAKVVLDDDDPERLARAVDAVTQVSVQNTPESFAAVAALAAELMAEREASPRQDLLQSIVDATVADGRPLTMEERLGVVTVLLLGGLDTTRGALAYIAEYLTELPDLEARLRQPDWAAHDLDELLRHTSTVSVMGRVVVEDNDLLGVPLHKGDRLAVHWRSGNRDTARFTDPARLDFDRTRNPHLAFGVGIHRCVGRHFARMQLDIAVTALLSRLTAFRVAPGAEIRRSVGISVGAPRELRLRFDRFTIH
ncbi:cytochrome P450 [Nocardia yunnanensis]|uniref:Cytochrome P450 n=1 Tax=Nocardia yunnanensis TaxID=2382165 RepID=A0A386Z8E1_9NOCA|nr:cytochrome P450 [Nocardia yunnanensis]AYF73896.1 cytochrome P450 [Nocardia yunnanensis]